MIQSDRFNTEFLHFFEVLKRDGTTVEWDGDGDNAANAARAAAVTLAEPSPFAVVAAGDDDVVSLMTIGATEDDGTDADPSRVAIRSETFFCSPPIQFLHHNAFLEL